MKKRRRPFKTILAFLAVIALLVPAWQLFFGRMLFPLPFTGPYEGYVLDAASGWPIAGAAVEAVWECSDLPLKFERGRFRVRQAVKSDRNGRFEISPPNERGGFFQADLTFHVMANGYIEAVLVLDPNKRPLTPKEESWPFHHMEIRDKLPEKMNVSLEPSMAILLETIKSKDPVIRQTAAEHLGNIGPNAIYATTVLLRALRDRSPRVRLKAARALGEIRPDDKKVIEALTDLLQDPDKWTFREAAVALGKYGKNARSSVPPLIEKLNSDDHFYREEAANALGMIGPAAHTAAPVLRKLLETEKNPYVIEDAQKALKRIAP